MQQPVLVNSDLEIPEDIICPITQQIMTDPVILVESGHTYEREAILKHLQIKKTDPLTNQIITNILIAPNHTVKKMITSFLDKRKKISPHIVNETYLPESLIQTLLTAMQKNDQKLFSETLQKDSRLLMNDLEKNKNVLMLACESATVEILGIVLEKLESNLKTLKAVQSDNGLSLFLVVSRRLGLGGAARMAKALAWNFSDLQTLLALSIQNNEVKLAYIALTLAAMPTVDLLNKAYAEKKTEMVKTLLQAKFSLIQNEDQKGNNFLMRTIVDGYSELSLFLLAHDGDELNPNKTNYAKQSALHLAIDKKPLNLTVVDALLNHSKINVNQTNGQQESALHIAAKQNHLSIIEKLIKKGILLDAKNQQGKTALDIAYSHYDKGDFALLKHLVMSGARIEDLLLKAIDANQLALIQFLLNEAKPLVNPNISDSNGKSTLILAIEKNQLETVSLLLNHPWKIKGNEVDQQGNTGLHHAAMLGNQEMVKLLMEHHLPVKDKNKDGQTTIQVAKEKGYAKLANWMEETHRYKKIELFLKPLQEKIQEQAIEIQKQEKQVQSLTQELNKLSIFTQKYAQSLMTIAEKQQHLQTELVAACLKGNLGLVQQLESQGASLLHPNQEGLYPLAAAVYGCSLETVRYVESKLKNEAEKQWGQMDADKAKAQLDRWTPTELSKNATYGELGNWYVKYEGASWCVYYDVECLKRCNNKIGRTYYQNWGGWDGSERHRDEIIWAAGGKELWGAAGARARWHRTVYEKDEAEGFQHQNYDFHLLISPHVSVHNDVVKNIREQLNKLRSEVETKVKPSSVAVFNRKV